METKQMTKQEKIDFGVTKENLRHFIMNNEMKIKAIFFDYPELIKELN